MIELLIAQYWPYVLGVLAMVGAIFGYGQHKKAQGKTEALVKTAEQGAKARKELQNVDKKIDAMGDDAIRDRAADKWVQDNTRSR